MGKLAYEGLSISKVCFNGDATVKLLYNGQTVWPETNYPNPVLRFEFSEADFIPTTGLVHANYRSYVTWYQVSSSPNQWDLTINRYVVFSFDGLWGLSCLFCDSQTYAGFLKPAKLGGGTCKLVGAYNLDSPLQGNFCESFDRMFCDCTGLTSFVTLQNPHVKNVGGMFQGCVNVEEGALDQYDWLSTYGVNITNHSSTFKDCGSDTVTGLDELDQIPSGWGGNLVPPATLTTSARKRWWSQYDTWEILTGAPDWSDMMGIRVFTTSSVSSYAGVSMNRSRIKKINGLNTTQSQSALYFYPCFMQHNSTVVTWCVVPGTPNGSLTIGQGSTDMPGTLDSDTYGAFAHEFGTYATNDTVYFCFLVTNVPIADWSGLTDAYGILYNGNFLADGGFRWTY